MNIDHCKSCHQAIVWLPTAANKTMPIDFAAFVDMPTDEFNHSAAPLYDHKVHQAHVHWSTCPHADSHRRARKGK